jgi:hypothetical protein
MLVNIHEQHTDIANLYDMWHVISLPLMNVADLSSEFYKNRAYFINYVQR